MKPRVFRFDQLCGALADAVVTTNAALISQSSALEKAPDVSFVYRLNDEDDSALRCISRAAIYGSVVCGIRELSFSVPCCVGTRVVGGCRQDVLELRAPAWWRRIVTKVDCRELQVDVGHSHLAMRLLPTSKERMPTRGLACIFVLTPENRAALGMSE